MQKYWKLNNVYGGLNRFVAHELDSQGKHSKQNAAIY
jgi:hypothetical protein